MTITREQIKAAMRYYVHGEGAAPGYAIHRALIGRGLLTVDGQPTNIGVDVAGPK